MKYLLTAVFLVVLVLVIFHSAVQIIFPLKYKSEIEYAAAVYGVDKTLIASVIYSESGFNAEAVSSKGAVGLMQILPSTAKFISSEIDINLKNENLSEPHINIMLGTCYIRYLLNKFVDVKTVLIAYNAGEGNAASWLEGPHYAATVDGIKVLTDSPFSQTNAYVKKVFKARKFYKNRF